MNKKPIIAGTNSFTDELMVDGLLHYSGMFEGFFKAMIATTQIMEANPNIDEKNFHALMFSPQFGRTVIEETHKKFKPLSEAITKAAEENNIHPMQLGYYFTMKIVQIFEQFKDDLQSEKSKLIT